MSTNKSMVKASPGPVTLGTQPMASPAIGTGKATPGFGGGSADSSTLCGHAGVAPHKPGGTVTGFSGGGVHDAKV